jgi:hypothetical protein
MTTNAQADALSAIYPSLPILVRPNGYDPTHIPMTEALIEQRKQPSETLSIVHFGDLYPVRLDVSVLLERLVDSGLWSRIAFSQYGHDWHGLLDLVPPGIHVMEHKPVPWSKAIETAARHDVAIVIGNHGFYQLPSKAVQYLTLPIPRLAFTNGRVDDALTQYVSGKSGWMTASLDDPRAAERLKAHLMRNLGLAELTPPQNEAWTLVADEIAEFVSRVLPICDAATSPV